MLEEDINSLTDNIKDVLQESAAEVLGKRRKKNKPWVTEDILDLCDTRRELKKTKRVSPSAAQQYSVVNKDIRKKMKEAKEKWIFDQCDNIEAGMSKGNSKAAFDTLKLLTRPQQPRATIIEDKEGTLLTEETATIRRWTEYCGELYNHKLNPDTSTPNNATNTNREPGEAPILLEEVEEAR